MSIEYILIGITVLLILCILASKASSRFGVPALLIFLAIGMLAGSDGPGGIHLAHPALAQAIGVVALSFILLARGVGATGVVARVQQARAVAQAGDAVLLTALLV